MLSDPHRDRVYVTHCTSLADILVLQSCSEPKVSASNVLDYVTKSNRNTHSQPLDLLNVLSGPHNLQKKILMKSHGPICK